MTNTVVSETYGLLVRWERVGDRYRLAARSPDELGRPGMLMRELWFDETSYNALVKQSHMPVAVNG